MKPRLDDDHLRGSTGGRSTVTPDLSRTYCCTVTATTHRVKSKLKHGEYPACLMLDMTTQAGLGASRNYTGTVAYKGRQLCQRDAENADPASTRTDAAGDGATKHVEVG